MWPDVQSSSVSPNQSTKFWFFGRNSYIFTLEFAEAHSATDWPMVNDVWKGADSSHHPVNGANSSPHGRTNDFYPQPKLVLIYKPHEDGGLGEPQTCAEMLGIKAHSCKMYPMHQPPPYHNTADRLIATPCKRIVDCVVVSICSDRFFTCFVEAVLLWWAPSVFKLNSVSLHCVSGEPTNPKFVVKSIMF
jgi:hypothetical protein